MESSRSQKTRSIGTESKSSKSSKSSKAQRPELGDRVQSAPSVARKHQSLPPSSQKTIRNSTLSVRASKVPSRDEGQPKVRDSHRSSPALEKERCDETYAFRERSSSRHDGVPQINLVVLGAAAVGKSTFIQNALDLRKRPTAAVSSSKVSLDGVLYRIRLLELLLDGVDYSSGRRVVWPKHVDKDLLPSVDGVLCLYDITDQDSIAEVPGLLAALSNSNLPCVLISCKSDRPASDREVDPAFESQVRTRFPSVQVAGASASRPETQKRCILTILKAILARSRESSRHPSPHGVRPQASPARHTAASGPDQQQSRSHSRSKSELPRSRSREPPALLPSSCVVQHDSANDSDSKLDSDEGDKNKDGREVTHRLPDALSIDTNFKTLNKVRPTQPPTPRSSSGHLVNGLVSPAEVPGSATPETPQSLYMAAVHRPETADTADSQVHNTFLNMDEESPDDSAPSHNAVEPQQVKKLDINESPKDELGVPFTELVDRLLTLPNSKQETKFLPIFLCLYRAFATPSQLLTSMISRFERVEKSKNVQLIKAGEQLRYLQILARWTADYPGDFAGAAVRAMAASFVGKIGKIRQFAPAAKEISNNLETLAADDDADWAYRPTSSAATSVSANSTTRTSPVKIVRSAKHPTSPKDNDDESDRSDDANSDSTPRHSGAPSTASSIARTTNTSSQSLSNLLVLESNRQKAQKLVPIPRTRLSKIQWHLFMNTPAEDFAREVTRIDWTMYSAIRPREFIRHVKLSTEQKRKSNHVDNISMMVKHFNHLGLFVSGMILLRDKPKHRAKALEKFMMVAWKVRQLNNYNSLGAIVAGLNGPEIQRLGLTRELVPAMVQKDFLRLTILMSHGRGHATYRMAWENSFAERIPFIPLVRQDLTRTELSNRTFVGANNDKIHWAKFEIMGDVVVGIQKSQQEHAYNFAGGPEVVQAEDQVRKMILETKVLEGSEDSPDPRDELQRRSELLEPAGVMVDGTKKKFDWFRR